MADGDDGLTDAELRAQLKQYGINHGPITASTRGILLKKLKNVKDGNSGVGSPSRQTKNRRSIATSTPTRQRAKVGLSGFSSEEDDFGAAGAKSMHSPASVSRRRSAFPKLPAAKNDSEQSAVDLDLEEAVPTVTRRRSLPRNALKETRSLDRISNVNDLSSRRKTNFVDGEQIHKIRNDARKNSFQFEENDGTPAEKYEESSSTIISRVSRKSGSLSATEISTNNRVSPKNRTSSKQRSLKDTNALSNSKVSDEDAEQDDEEIEVGFDQSSSTLQHLKGPFFSLFVLLLLIVLAGSYMSLWHTRSTELPALIDVNGNQGEKDKILLVLQCLHNHLAKNAGLAECGYTDANFTIKGEKVASFAGSCFDNFKDTQSDFNKLAVDVVNTAMDEKYAKFFKVEDLRSEKNGPVRAKTLSKIRLSSNVVDKPLTCRLKNAFQLLSRYIIILVLVLGFLLTVYFMLKRRWMMDDENTRLMFIYVEKIIETLRRHSEACKHDKELLEFLPIPHVRDMLIPPRERDAKEKAWKKAVDFLSSTDSRIRVETRRIAGEDFEVWRWIGVTTTDPKIKGAKNHLGPEEESGKFWQGPAFDRLEKVVRMPIITPTPCLKIRYLHGGPAEKEDGWDRRVRDALLEKCQEDNAKILHVYVDTKSAEGCVYVKCDSLESAGKAFRSIYGNWFDGRLVIVKFVTLARYHQRFPDALTCNQALKSTGEFPSSLSWDSVTGTTEVKTT